MSEEATAKLVGRIWDEEKNDLVDIQITFYKSDENELNITYLDSELWVDIDDLLYALNKLKIELTSRIG